MPSGPGNGWSRTGPQQFADVTLIERILAHRRERGEEAAPTASLGAAGTAAGVAVLVRVIVDGLALLRRGRRAVLRAARREPPIGSAESALRSES